MVTPKAQHSLKQAKTYFREHLAQGDYYSEKASVHGLWIGEGAKALNLEGGVSEEAFLQMCDGRDPNTGKRLTVRSKTVRVVDGKTEANRIVFYDFVVRPPKSLSLVALCSDDRIKALHQEAVTVAVRELEKYAATRVRRKGANENRRTGNIVAAQFVHETSRAQDPLLHTHVTVFNATFDKDEGRWKALQTREMYGAQRLVDAVYSAHLTAGLVRLGYGIERSQRSFEIEGVSPTLIKRFSKRREAILESAANARMTLGERIVNVFRLRDRIAHDERQRKIKVGDSRALRASWLGGMTSAERDSLLPGKRTADHRPRGRILDDALRVADGMTFERKAVVKKETLEAAILHETLGTGIALEEVRKVLEGGRYLASDNGASLADKELLGLEQSLVAAAQAGRGTQRPIDSAYAVGDQALDKEQREAVDKLCKSRDMINLFNGRAGTGKSRTLQEVVRAIEGAGLPAIVCAPGAAQARDLSDHGMEANTLAAVLVRGPLPPRAVVVMDEAGQVGIKGMVALLQKVREAKGRLILSGDTYQHGAVEASEAMRALERFAALPAAFIRRIRRQDPKLGQSYGEMAKIAGYRRAVEAASEGKAALSFERLERLGVIAEVEGETQAKSAADRIVAVLAKGESVLGVTQTRDEARKVNREVTDAAVAVGMVTDTRPVEILNARDLLKVESRLARTYKPGDELRFVTRYGENHKGDIRKVSHVLQNGVILEPRAWDKQESFVGFKQAHRWQVVDREEVQLGIGSRIQMKANGDGFVNGELCTVRDFLKDGRIVVEAHKRERKTIAPDSRVMAPGYCLTSYSAQGKSASEVVFCDAGNPAASSLRQWYVSISRGKKNISVFTPDKRKLKEMIRQKGDDELAMELKANKLRTDPSQNMFLGIARRARMVREVAERVGRRIGQGFNTGIRT